MLIQHKRRKLVLWNAEKKKRVANEILYSAITLNKAIELAKEENANGLAADLAEAQNEFVGELMKIVRKHHLDKVQVKKVVA